MIRTLRRLHVSPRTSTSLGRSATIGATDMDLSQPYEEERLPWYRPDQFYPVRIGETMASRYRVVGKLGYGAHSTSWLCRDLRHAGFVAVKVCTLEADQSDRYQRELRFYEHVSAMTTQHPGQFFIRGLLDSFTVDVPKGKHLCLVQQPMHMTIRELQYQNPSRRLTQQLLKWTLSNVLRALSFLHDEAGVIHTGESISRPVVRRGL
nr:srsf protein kinase 3 [Quercus suber]